jgi:hypothetical protein
MRQIIFTSILFFISISLFSQVQSNCERSWGFDHYYKKDVAYLTYERLRELKLPDTNEIYMPFIYQDTIWRGLSAIYNAVSIPAHDSVFYMYCIHNTPMFQTPNCSYIEVYLDTTYSWTNNWFNGIIETGYEELDKFTAKYSFFVDGINFQENTIYLNSYAPINTTPLLDSLLVFDGVIDSYPWGEFVKKNVIRYEINGDFQYFDFALRWGDCLSGCSQSHTWKYKVNLLECTVEYLGSEISNSGGYPDPVFCEISAIEPIKTMDDISVFPNPTINNLITIEGQEIQELNLLDINGKKLVSSIITDNKHELDIESFKSGIYILLIKTNDKIISKKIIKP